MAASAPMKTLTALALLYVGADHYSKTHNFWEAFALAALAVLLLIGDTE
jgi:hypothetical protein